MNFLLVINLKHNMPCKLITRLYVNQEKLIHFQNRTLGSQYPDFFRIPLTQGQFIPPRPLIEDEDPATANQF